MDTLSFRPYFDSGSISRAEVCTLLDHLEAALHFMVDNPRSLVCDVELVNDREMRLLLPKETEGEFTYQNQCLAYDITLDSIQNVPELIELQVQRTPQKIAVSLSMLEENIYNDVSTVPIRSRCVLDI